MLKHIKSIWGLLAVIAIIVLLFIISAVIYHRSHPSKTDAPPILESKNRLFHEEIPFTSVTIHPGDNLIRIFNRQNIPTITLYELLKNPNNEKYLKNIKPGEVIDLQIKNGQLTALNYPISANEVLQIKQIKGAYQSVVRKVPTENRMHYFNCTIKHSLSRDLNEQGVSPGMIAQLEKIFSDQINFQRSLRPGDQIQLIVKEVRSPHQHPEQKTLMAASIQHRGQTYQAFRYTNAINQTHYFNKNGASLQRAFSRYPVKYLFISSKFNPHRMHPILHVLRPHYGVDFAAPIGRPVHATADGQIFLIGPDSGYGNTIKIRNTSSITTIYAHLSRFAPQLKRHSWVKKGQVIAYVGSSGLSTGPHLHYEIRIHNIPKDPLTVNLPRNSAIAKKYRNDFLAHAQQLQQALNHQQSTHWVSHESSTIKPS